MCGKESRHKKYKYVPPDGGWGYMICIAVTTTLVIVTGFVNCFGVIFKERFIELSMGSMSVTVLNGLGAMCLAISGFSTGFSLKYMSIRKLGFIAACLYSTGLFGTTLCDSRVMFFIFQGILQNLGHGMLINLCFTIIIQYFDQKRLFAMSIIQTITALAAFGAPALVKWSLERYGTHWSLLLISAISLHNIFAVTLMQPVLWHLKKVDVPETKEIEMKPFIKDNKYKRSPVASITYDNDALDASKRNKNGADAEKGQNIIMKFVGKELYKKFILSNACLGLSICLFSDMSFILMLPQALYYMGWNEALVARALTLFGLGNLLTRILFIFISKWLAKIGTHEIYVIGLLIACLSRLGMLWSDDRTIMLSFLVIMGLGRCIIVVLHPLVIAESVSPDKFTNAMGISMLVFGLVNLVFGPVISAIRVLTDSYATAFYILTSCFGIVVIFWTIELVYKKNAHKRKPK